MIYAPINNKCKLNWEVIEVRNLREVIVIGDLNGKIGINQNGSIFGEYRNDIDIINKYAHNKPEIKNSFPRNLPDGFNS